MANYTVEMDMRSTEKRRQQGDIGVIAQRYVFVLFGNSQKVELQPWQPNVEMTKSAPFAWKGDTWYRVKLEVQNQKDGTVRARGQGVAARRSRAGGVARRDDRQAGAQGTAAPASTPTRRGARPSTT